MKKTEPEAAEVRHHSRIRILTKNRFGGIVAVVLLGVVGLFAYRQWRQRLLYIPPRPLRIGFESNPPVQIRTANGFSGLAVEVAAEAARRAGIQLQWVETGLSSYESFQKGLVDLWPLMVDRPERRNLVHFARPWMHSTYAALVRGDSPAIDQRFSGSMAVLGLPLHVGVIQQHFPHARPMPQEDLTQVIQLVCRGEADAAFLESRAAVGQLREVSPECSSARLRVQEFPHMVLHAGVASTYDAAGAAEAIEREIDRMFQDGSLAALIAKYSYFGLEDTWASYQAVEAAQRSRWLSWTISGLIVALAFALWQGSSLRARKRAEAALRESEERFRNLSNTAPVMIVECGPDGKAVFFNKVWLDFTGRSMKQELGFGWTDGLHPDDRKKALADYANAFRTRTRCHVEHRLRRSDGEYRYLVCNGVPHFREDGTFGGFIASYIDLTDIRRSQEEGWARQNLESLGVMAGGVAHDFNNLLGGVLSYSEVAQTKLADGSKPNLELEQIKTLALRGSEIVRQLMILAGKETGAFHAVDVCSLVNEMVELLKVSISKHATLEIDTPEGLPPVEGNAAGLRQVAMNLIMNASEALGDRDGVIRISVGYVRMHAASAHNGRAETLPQGQNVQLEVSDTGCGMTRETLDRMFDPFFTTKFAGRGMGLATVKRIVQALNGTIHAVSEVGQGTSIRVVLPCAKSGAQSSQPGVAPETSITAGPVGAVLIVEDESMLRSAVSRMLQRKGYRVIEAADGTAALKILRGSEDRIDAMLLDLTLPGASSRDVLQEASRLCPDMKTILTSAYSRETVQASLPGLGPMSFIRKPFQIGELFDLLGDPGRE